MRLDDLKRIVESDEMGPRQIYPPYLDRPMPKPHPGGGSYPGGPGNLPGGFPVQIRPDLQGPPSYTDPNRDEDGDGQPDGGGAITWPDGTVEFPDGSIVYPDGSVRPPGGGDGKIYLPNGNYYDPDTGMIHDPEGNPIMFPDSLPRS